ncbi:hypothetical protein PH5382_01434 [Phaeobacter sp. CECT 5382]|nr:hypothetical protein PH5382_01434 [Phaeobacter sp. CECT 5382]
MTVWRVPPGWALILEFVDVEDLTLCYQLQKRRRKAPLLLVSTDCPRFWKTSFQSPICRTARSRMISSEPPPMAMTLTSR